MANVTNLLHINVDKLFEQCGVADIDLVHKRLQSEVELKREELRTMVGERYRDLLKAADTIGDMRTTAGSIIENVDTIQAACRKLNDHQLIGFRTDHQQRKLRKTTNDNFHAVIVQIKLLTSLPEMIWSAIDGEDFFVATQLFIFSRHISTGLQLDSNAALMAKFPVAKKQWAVLSQFFYTIKQNCSSCLEREDLQPEVAAKCLASLVLLESCQLDHILSVFVQMRLKAFAGVLAEGSRHEKVRDKILASLKLLMNTVELIHTCFVGVDGLLMRELNFITGENAQPTIGLIKSEDPKIIQTLPDIISRFRPRIQLEALGDERVGKHSNIWLQNVEKIATNQLSKLMNLVPSIKVLHDIRKLSLTVAKKPESWSSTCAELSLQESLDFYSKFYQPLINARVRTIIKQCWLETIAQNGDDVSKLLTMNASNKQLRDVKSYVWQESSEDVPLNLKDALDCANLASHQLLMKSRAFPPPLVELVSSLDNRLESLTKDVTTFLGASTPDEAQQLIEFYSDCSSESISQLLTTIKSADYERSPENYVLLARLLVAFKELCPALKKCLTPSQLSNAETLMPWQSEDSELDAKKDRWNNAAGLLDEESLAFWKLWLEQFVKKWPVLEGNVGYHTLLTEFPLWDTVTIEENDEQNQPVQSTIRVPAMPSFPLQKLLHVIATLLNSLIPHTIPKRIISQILDLIGNRLLAHYQTLTASEFIQRNQNCSLQYYFDLKFIQLLFTADREKKQQTDALIATYRAHIDPFDFDVFHAHVNANVKRAVTRMQHFFGVLLVNGEPALGGSATTTANKSGQDRNPNILALASNSASETWFPLLPIVTKEATAQGNAGQDAPKVAKVADEKQKQPGGRAPPRENQAPPKAREPSREPPTPSSSSSAVTAQNYAKGAAAFFGLDKDWFR
ncbi:conserved oligomeric Golgi complex subunit 1 isoform X1 [Culex quinquefasciatus]|uniref:conserved oligomeric Golgi complex subunit 1 isoform X1 n=1 Tax=Culex quinquefasciatus TaxID=7176 RepID=UPI0018E2FDFB|nr:conserved oligomeric Golgi complex subunit 1 isoform X1 [Culex quinquefasciatus]